MDTKWFHGALETISGPNGSGTIPLLRVGGITLLTYHVILDMSADHLNSVLNRLLTINNYYAIKRLPNIQFKGLFDDFPTVTETMKAIQHLSSGKAPDSGAIPAEIYIAGRPPMACGRKGAPHKNSMREIFKSVTTYLSIDCWKDTN